MASRHPYGNPKAAPREWSYLKKIIGKDKASATDAYGNTYANQRPKTATGKRLLKKTDPQAIKKASDHTRQLAKPKAIPQFVDTKTGKRLERPYDPKPKKPKPTIARRKK